MAQGNIKTGKGLIMIVIVNIASNFHEYNTKWAAYQSVILEMITNLPSGWLAYYVEFLISY